MARLFLFLFVAHVALAAAALISCLTPEKAQLRALPRAVWILVILFVPLLGPGAYFWAGRPVRPDARPVVERPRPLAPEDDPEFLRSLEAEQARQDREMFQRWEEDLRRREGDLRRQAGEQERDLRPQAGEQERDVRRQAGEQQRDLRRQAGEQQRGDAAPEN